jgi:mRNA interferase MazF
MPTTKPIAASRQFDIVIVPFPFTDIASVKRRPALVLSDEKAFNGPAGHSVMAMITTATHARWPLDVPITDLATAGLPAPSVVRMKVFTLDHRLVLRRSGHLGAKDQAAVRASLGRLLAM